MRLEIELPTYSILKTCSIPRTARFLTAVRLGRLRITRLLLLLLSDLNLFAFHQRIWRIDHHVFLASQPRHTFYSAAKIVSQHNPYERRFAARHSRNLQALRTEYQRVHREDKRRDSLRK